MVNINSDNSFPFKRFVALKGVAVDEVTTDEKSALLTDNSAFEANEQAVKDYIKRVSCRQVLS